MTSQTITLTIDSDEFPHLFEYQTDVREEKAKEAFMIGYRAMWETRGSSEVVQLRQEWSDIKNEILTEVSSLTSPVSSNIERLTLTVDRLFGISENSSKKGCLSESVVQQYIEKNFKDYHYQVTRNIAHSGDGILTLPSGQKIMFEVKNYSKPVNQDEIDKFYRDMKERNIEYGIFLSMKTSIVRHARLSIEGNKIIFASHVSENMNMIDASILMIQKLCETSSNQQNKIVTEKVRNTIEELERWSHTHKNLLSSYETMESTIRTSMETHYQTLRRHDDELNTIMHDFTKRMNHHMDNSEMMFRMNDNQDILHLMKDHKCIKILTKIYNIIKKKNIVIDNEYKLIKEKRTIGHIKILKKKISVSVLDLTFSYDENTREFIYKGMEQILETIQ